MKLVPAENSAAMRFLAFASIKGHPKTDIHTLSVLITEIAELICLYAKT